MKEEDREVKRKNELENMVYKKPQKNIRIRSRVRNVCVRKRSWLGWLHIPLHALTDALKKIYHKTQNTLLGELLASYRWKEMWIAFSLPLWILVFPALGFALFIMIPTPWNAVLIWSSLFGFVIGSVWGNPFDRR